MSLKFNGRKANLCSHHFATFSLPPFLTFFFSFFAPKATPRKGIHQFVSRIFNRLVILPLTLPLCLVMLLGVNGVMGQVTIASQNFESSPATPTWSFSNTNGSASTTNTGTPSGQRVRNGSRSYQFNNVAGTLTFGDITTTGYSSISIVVRISSISGSTGNGADAADYVRLFTKLNSNSFSTISIESSCPSISSTHSTNSFLFTIQSGTTQKYGVETCKAVDELKAK
jgi:hypothetical protein